MYGHVANAAQVGPPYSPTHRHTPFETHVPLSPEQASGSACPKQTVVASKTFTSTLQLVDVPSAPSNENEIVCEVPASEAEGVSVFVRKNGDDLVTPSLVSAVVYVAMADTVNSVPWGMLIEPVFVSIQRGEVNDSQWYRNLIAWASPSLNVDRCPIGFGESIVGRPFFVKAVAL